MLNEKECSCNRSLTPLCHSDPASCGGRIQRSVHKSHAAFGLDPSPDIGCRGQDDPRVERLQQLSFCHYVIFYFFMHHLLDRHIRRLRLVSLCFFVVLILVYVLWGDRLGLSKESIHRFVENAGPWAYVAFILLSAMNMSIVPAPVGPLVLIGSEIFGLWLNVPLSAAGLLVGGSVSFSIGRHVGKPFLRKLWGREKYEEVFAAMPDHATLWSVVAMRVISLPSMMDFAGFVAGFTRLSWPKYLIATVTWAFPVTIIWNFYGGLLLEGSWWTFLIATGIFVAGFLVARKYRIGTRLREFVERKTGVHPPSSSSV